jgi:hypothetical protein
LTRLAAARDSRPVTWSIRTGADDELEDLLTDRLVEHNLARSEAIRRRFEPGNLASRPVAAFAVEGAGDGAARCSAVAWAAPRTCGSG